MRRAIVARATSLLRMWLMDRWFDTHHPDSCLLASLPVTTLEERIRQRIRDEGPITFAAFMEAALYDPENGFYERAVVGPDAEFVTSPHVSPAFGALVARQLGECWELLGRPDPYRVAEVGAGDGTLARQVLEETASVPDLASALDYAAVERSDRARRTLKDAGVDAREHLQDAGTVHVVLANELLDNLPFHRLRGTPGGLREVRIGLEGDRIVEVEAEPTEEALEALREAPGTGEERTASPDTLRFLAQAAGVLERGYVFLFDYGFGPGERPGEVHAYLAHRVSGDVLSAPGSRDITAAVDLGAVAAEAQRLGLTAWGPVTQRDALLGLGIRLWIAGMRRRVAEAEAREDHRAARRLFEAISRASMLVDEDKLGALRLLVLGTEGLRAPAAALGDRQTGC